MRLPLRRLVVLATAAGVALAGAPTEGRAQRRLRSATRSAGSSRADTNALRAAPSAIFAAIARGDTAVLRRRLGADLRWVVATRGAVIDRSRLLAAAAGPPPGAPRVVTLEYAVDSVTTWQHGDVATAEYRVTDRRTFRGHQNVFVSRASDLFVFRRPHGWELVRHTQAWIVGPPALLDAADSATLVPFVGRYDRGAGYIDDVHFREGHLVAQSTLEALLGAPGAHLRPVSGNTFSPEGVAPMIVFERDAQGRVTGYVQQEPDGTIVRARRLPTPP